jgi:hypothetical protein
VDVGFLEGIEGFVGESLGAGLGAGVGKVKNSPPMNMPGSVGPCVFEGVACDALRDWARSRSWKSKKLASY